MQGDNRSDINGVQADRGNPDAIFGKPRTHKDHASGVLPDRGDPALILGAQEEHETSALPDRANPDAIFGRPSTDKEHALGVLPDQGDPSTILPDLRSQALRVRLRLLLKWGLICGAIGGVVLVAVIGLAGRMQPAPEELYARAERARAEGKIPQAIVDLKSLLQRQPENAEARYLLARCYLASGEAKAAESELRHAMAYGKRPADVWPLLGRSMLQQRQYQKLLDEIPAEEADASPDAAEINTVRGLAKYALGRPGEAATLLEKALTVAKEYPDALLGLARIAAQSRRLDEAEALIGRALAADPRSLDGWMLKADLEFAHRRPDGAAEAYRKLLAVYPANVPVRLALAAILIDQGALEAASKYVFAINREAPLNARANYLRSLIEYRNGKLDVARGAILLAFQSAPADPATQLLAGIVLYATGAYREASIPLLLTLEKNPAQAGPRKLYAGALMKTGQTARALEVLLPTLSIARNDRALHGLIGGAYLRLGNVAQATQYLSKAVVDEPLAAKSPAHRPVIGAALPSADDIDRALRTAPNETSPEKLLLIAYIQAQQFDQALAAMTALRKDVLEDPEILTLQGTILMSRKEYPAARAALEKALALAPQHAPAAANLAQIDLAEGDPPNARKRLQRIVTRDPTNVNALAALAALGPALGAKDAEVLDWLEQARAASPKSTQLTLMLVQHHLRTGNYPAALEISKEAEKVGGDSPDVLRVVGSAQLASGDIAKAAGTFSRLLALQPDSPVALRVLAQAQLAGNNLAGATVLLRKALQIRPGDFDALLMLAETERRAGRLGAALNLVREAQKRAPQLPGPYVLEGDVLTQQRDSAGAVRAYEDAFARRRTGEVVIRMHVALDSSGSSSRGENAVLGWLQDNPADIPVRAHFGHFLLQRDRLKEAAEEYEKVLKGDPSNAVVLNNLAWIFDQQKDPRAQEYAERAQQLAPKDPAALDTLASVLLRRGETDRGIDLLLRAVTLAPENADVRLHLAQAWLKSGNKPKARRELEILVAGFKDYPRIGEAKSMLARINE